MNGTTGASPRKKWLYGILLVLTAALALAALLSPVLMRLLTQAPAVGQVAGQDILAREPVSYTSAVLTEQRRAEAAAAVAPVYTSPDTNLARQQLERLRAAQAYITSVRTDAFATPAQKLEDLAALEDIHIPQELGQSLLGLNDARWQAVQQESISVLEQIMRRSIRPEALEDQRQAAPSLVSLALPEAQARIVSSLAGAFVVANSFYSENLTGAERQKASQAVNPVAVAYAAGQTVVRRGQVLGEVEVEALEKMGLAQPVHRLQDPLAAGALVGLMAVFAVIYLRRNPVLPEQGRSLALISALYVAFLLGARLTISGHTLLPYAFPLAAYGLTVTALFGAELAMFTSLPLAVMVAYNLPNTLDLTLFYLLGGLFGILVLGRARRMNSFFWAGIAIALAGAGVLLVYRLPSPSTDWIGLASLVAASLFNGLASTGLALLLQAFLAQPLGMTTPMQLMELTRPDNPLLQKILHDAPGTYQHSLQVANLAEQAAERIGADPLLTRVGALYHDAGKSLNPAYFIENQAPGYLNPHDDLDPVSSAATILQHVHQGLELARRYRLPRRIGDFIAEHHGTMLTNYQYVRAVKAAGGEESEVDAELFRYPGPRPRSRETGILLLADGCEARVRASYPKEEDLRDLIQKEVDKRVAAGQLNDTSITLHDLEVIVQSFTATLRGIYHPRIQYPELEKGKSREATQPRQAARPALTGEAPAGAKVESPPPPA